MTFKQTTIALLSIACVFMLMDFFVNGYSSLLKFEPSTEAVENSTETVIKSRISQDFLAALPETVTVEDPVLAKTLFNRLIVSELPIEEAAQTLLLDDGDKFGIVYEFSGGADMYFQLRAALELILSEDDTLVDANNLGDYSLYYNDSKRPEIVFMLSLIDGRIWGFEYPRYRHADYKKLTPLLL